MSCLFGNLVAVRRGEESLYCLLEARVKLFANIDDNRLSYAMSFLGINTLACTESELVLLERTLPPQFAPFQLVSEQNLLRLRRLLLLDFSQVESRTLNNLNIQFPFATNQRAEFSLPAPPLKQKHVQSDVVENQNNASYERQCNRDNELAHHKSAARLESIPKVESVKADGRHLANAFSSVERKSHEIGQSSEISREESTEVSEEKKDKRPSVTLSESEMSADLRAEFSEIRKFYSEDINCNREGTSLQNNTIDKIFERTSAFLWFLKHVKKIDPALICCSNPEMVQEFVHFMMDKRGVKPVTCSRYISALINVSKVPLDSQDSSDKEISSENLEKIRAIQRQLERLARKERVDNLAQKPELEKVVYPEILELCRELKWEVDEKRGSLQARACMNLCLLLLYCAANPGRAKEYVTLRIYKDQTVEQSKNQNFICFNEDGSVILFEDDYKTRPTYGPNRTDLTELTFLTYYLRLYYSQSRPLLLCGKEHDYFFVNQRGDPFSQTSYGNYITALFEQYFNVKLTTVDIRKAVVNYFLTLPQSSDYSLRESFATLMKHSVRTQKRYYDERPLAQKKRKALDLLGSVACRSLGEGSIEIVSDEDEQLNIELLPAPGEFVALVAANSTNNVPEIFVGRVLRLSDDRKTAYLAEFSEVEPGKFKLTAGKSYRDSVNALIHPIDIVYSNSNGLYELRTSKLEIHQQKIMANGLMARYAERMRKVMMGEVLKAIGLLPQLYEQFLATDDQTMVSLPGKNYCRVISLPLLTYVSEFYEAFLRNTSTKRSCPVCLNQHSRNQLCLPDLFDPEGLDLLFDMLERKRFYLCSRDDLVSLIKICGYLCIKSEILHAFLLNLLSPNEVSTWESGTAFVYELYWNGYLESVAYYARSVDHPDFLSLLKANESYRKVKKQLRSYHRYREFARAYTYPSGRVKFSKVRAAFFWDYYNPPPMQPEDYPEYGW